MKLNGKLSSGMQWQYDEENLTILVYGENAAGEKEWLEPYWDTLTEAEQDELAAIGTEVNDLLVLKDRIRKVTAPFEVESGPMSTAGEVSLSLTFPVKKTADWVYLRRVFQDEWGDLMYTEQEVFRDFCSPNAPRWESERKPVDLHFLAHYEKAIRRALEEDRDIQAVFGRNA